MAITPKFTVNVELKFGGKSNIKTLFHDDWRYFTIPSKMRTGWRDNEGEGTYAFEIAPDLLGTYKNSIQIYGILQSIERECKDSYMQISANRGRYSMDDKGQLKFEHYRCNVSLLLLRKLKLLFISSYVYNSTGEELPSNFNESMKLEFDVKQKTVLLRAINIYNTDDIYLRYAREAAQRSSFDSIFLTGDKPEGKAKNFYKMSSPWYEHNRLDELEKQVQNTGEDIYNVIYMLYNREDKSIYVGKADRLIARLKQHENKRSLAEPMPVFTHFRYSVIAEGYEDYIYIIENSAIHDLACIFSMPNAKTYRSPLSKICKDIRIQEIKMNNSAETQTKIKKF